MNPLIKALTAVLLMNVGGFIWFGFNGWWTLSGLALLWVAAAMIGSLAAEAERP
jgi:hypothetical protein